MICEKCKSKSVARGIKKVKCIKCDKETMVNMFHHNICIECSNREQICQYCGNKK